MLTTMKLASAALFAIFLPAIAAAQHSGIYIQAGPLADILFTGSADGIPVTPAASLSSPGLVWDDSVSSSVTLGFPSVNRQSQSRVAPGASAALGVFITPSVSLRVEGSYQGEHVRESALGGAGQLISLEERQASSTTDIFVAAGWHQGGSRRTTITYLAGMVFRRQREEATLSYTYAPRIIPPPIGQPGIFPPVGPIGFSEQFGATTYGMGMMAGVDVTFAFSTHLAVVPQLRMVAANHELSLRPGLSLQWRP